MTTSAPLIVSRLSGVASYPGVGGLCLSGSVVSTAVEQMVSRLVQRDSDRTEADLQSDLAALLQQAPFDLSERQVVKREVALQDGTRRRIDVQAGHLVVETKRDLRASTVAEDAREQLKGYLMEMERETAGRYAGVVTDGVTWVLYRLRDGEADEVTRLVLPERDPDADRLVVWLDSILATKTQIRPTPGTIRELLGAESPAHRFDHAVLAGILHEAETDQETQLKRQLWAKLLRTAYGEAFEDDEKLFVNHTLLVITAEAIAHAIIGFDVVHQLREDQIVSGELFAGAQVYGVVEQDFFDWPIHRPGGKEFIADLVRRVARFDWSDVDHDVLKVLYESVIEQRDRQELGEYYTPDWLARQMVADRVTEPATSRVLDPSCGSGTFLFHAVKAHLEAVEAEGVSPGQAAVSATRHVFGVDIHPVAVTLARVTYLMAIGTSRLNHPDRGPLRVPVFLGDSLQWERHRDLFSDDRAVAIATGSEDLVSGGGGSLFSDELVFPASVWENGTQFDSIVTVMADLVDKVAGPGATDTEAAGRRQLGRALTRFKITGADDQSVLTQTFATWVGLRRTGRDHIWGYYVRNLIRPVWFAQPNNRVDVLVGNPPWLRYSKMAQDMQDRYKELAKPRNLLTGGLGASARDLSTLFVTRAIELYLRDGGVFGFVMPYGTLSRKPHTGFRSGDWRNPDSTGLSVHFDTAWDLHTIGNLFPMTSCVVRGTHADTPGPMTGEVIPWAGPTHRQPAHPLPVSVVAAIDAGDEAASLYATVFRDGAILYPRMLVFVETIDAGPLGAGAGRIKVRSARTNQEKAPWKTMPSLEGVIESEFLRAAHLGETVLSFRALPPRPCVLPIVDGHLADSMDELSVTPAMSQWWNHVEDHWETGRVARETEPLYERLDYHGQLRAQLPPPSNRVVYTKSGNVLAAARLKEDDQALIDHKLYWATLETPAEALYLVGILNSGALLSQVSQYQAVGLFGARDFDKYVFQVPIPAFDPTNPAHSAISLLAEQAEQAAASVDVPQGIRFQDARKLVNAELDRQGISLELEDAVSRLIDKK